ncbi:MAG TPA: response regulator [Cyclobacteriaceae bacterium]
MKKTILFIDDQEINLFVLEKRFEDTFNVLTASTNAEAKRIVKNPEQKIDALITDLGMPDMNGLEFLKQYNAYLQDVKCFLLTGYNIDDEIKSALKEKVVLDVFKKPYEYDHIQKTLLRYL